MSGHIVFSDLMVAISKDYPRNRPYRNRPVNEQKKIVQQRLKKIVR